MSRRRRPEKRVILPDPKFGDLVLSKFMNNLMLDGKKSVAERIVYGALETVEAKAKKDPVQLFHDALNNVKPGIEVRSRRVGGATYQVPCEVRPERASRCCQQPWQCSQEARRYAPHGRSQPRLCTLSLVSRDTVIIEK
jgi:ribosomal protein S7